MALRPDATTFLALLPAVAISRGVGSQSRRTLPETRRVFWPRASTRRPWYSRTGSFGPVIGYHAHSIGDAGATPGADAPCPLSTMSP